MISEQFNGSAVVFVSTATFDRAPLAAVIRSHRGGRCGAAPQVGETRFAARRLPAFGERRRIGNRSRSLADQFSMPSACM